MPCFFGHSAIFNDLLNHWEEIDFLWLVAIMDCRRGMLKGEHLARNENRLDELIIHINKSIRYV